MTYAGGIDQQVPWGGGMANDMIIALTGFGGVVVGGVLQAATAFFVVSQQRKFRLTDEAAERNRSEAQREADRTYTRAILARHLEAFARSCASAMWANGNPENDDGMPLPSFPAWPEVDWKLLGAGEMTNALDIEVQVEMRKDRVDGDIIYGASHADEAKAYTRDGAARLGWDAWNIAKRLRVEAGIAPFQFPEGTSNYAEALQSHMDQLNAQETARLERRAARRAERIAAGEEPDPFD